jgi:aminoglycoside phosphotransferase (APT) family kinase protein
MASENLNGVDIPNVTAWLGERVAIERPLGFDLIPHGRSNLTFIVTDGAGSRWVLRRPPLGHVLASAHDMGRERRIIAALQGSGVPVPGVVGMCDDTDVIGAPFYVMDFIEGHIIKTLEDAEPFTTDQRRQQSESLVDVLAVLHALDPDDVGLGELGKKEDYVARQLRRWKRQVDEGSDRDLPLFNELHVKLEAAIPTQQGAGIVHGDYRLDNTMVGHDNSVAAVLDWELCTLGDVLADLGGLIVWWGDPDSADVNLRNAPTLAPGHLTEDEVIARYAVSSSRDLSDLPYYLAFQFWRLAAIIEGVRVRFVAGAMGDKDIGEEMAGFEARVDGLLEGARQRYADL